MHEWWALPVAAAVAALGGCTSVVPLAALGPDAADFVANAAAQPGAPPPPISPDASTGSYTVDCGRNENGHTNSDNVITRPGERDAAHHAHEYVGNTSTDAFSTDTSLAAAATTCANGDRSTYFWPVLRLVGAEHDHSAGTALKPASVRVRFGGSPVSKVVAMPRFLRISAGNAKAVTEPDPQRRAGWTCSGSPGRSVTRYPRCPNGEQVIRVFDFPDCWDGRNIDSQNHRAQVLPAVAGVCPHGTFPIPVLHLLVAYDVPAGAFYAIDTFPEQRRSPLTDHADFINVMTDDLMASVVDCVNRGRTC